MEYKLAFMSGGMEIWVVVILALLLFGGSQIPKLAKSLGRAKKDFQDGLAEGETKEDDSKKDDDNVKG